MNVIVFGATGMVGQGVLRECLLDPDVKRVVSVVRRPSDTTHPKLREIVHANFMDFSAVEHELTGLDACFFCLGVTSFRMTEADYQRVTVDITVAAGETLARLNPKMTFVFVSGRGSDSTEKGDVMWARVKGRAENAVLRLPVAASYVFRPSAIEPLHGITSRTTSYRVLYAVMRPFMPLIKRMFPDSITTTEQVGLAMLIVAKHGAPKRVLEPADIKAIGSAPRG